MRALLFAALLCCCPVGSAQLEEQEPAEKRSEGDDPIEPLPMGIRRMMTMPEVIITPAPRSDGDVSP
jgi:hypothetical protein